MPLSLSTSSSLLLPHFTAPKTLNLKPLTETLTPKSTKTRKPFVAARHSEYFDPSSPSPSRLSSRPPQAPSPVDPFAAQPPSPPRVFVGYSIYKGKAALAVEPRPPGFAPLDSGAFKVAKEGFLLLQFAPAVAARQYDWTRKQVFSLSVSEIGTLISLGAKDSCEFFHDPFKGKGDEGKIRKVLKVEPLPDGTGHFFNLSVQNRHLNADESIYIPITKAEFAILNSTFNFIIPYLLGWNVFANAIRPDNASRSFISSQSQPELEWGR